MGVCITLTLGCSRCGCMYNTHWDVVGVGVCIALTLGCSRCGCMSNTHTGM